MNWTGVPAHNVYYGIRLPAGTTEFGPITALNFIIKYPL
jgi:hypothetical protein